LWKTRAIKNNAIVIVYEPANPISHSFRIYRFGVYACNCGYQPSSELKHDTKKERSRLYISNIANILYHENAIKRSANELEICGYCKRIGFGRSRLDDNSFINGHFAMEDAIRNFSKQFEWEPDIEQAEQWKAVGKYIICGMGGSHLQGDVFQNAYPGFDLSVHQDYGLPGWPKEVLRKTLVIASSYSGNTEETLSSFQEAVKNGYPAAAISTGGELLNQVKQHGVPYIQIPDIGIQPRSALGYTFKALAKMVGRDDVVKQATQVGKMLAESAATFEAQGKALAEKLHGKVPVIYASQKNYSIAYNWKIKFNETAKIPAFYNVFPELNHNEMNGFDVSDSTRELTKPFFFLFLRDGEDHPRIQKRMEVLEKQLYQRGLPVINCELTGNSRLEKIFSSLLFADWVALYLAQHYGRDPEQVPMIEEFKKLIG